MSAPTDVQELAKKVEELTRKLSKKNESQISAVQRYHKTPKGIISRKKSAKLYYQKIKKVKNAERVKELKIEQRVLESRIEQIKTKVAVLSR